MGGEWSLKTKHDDKQDIPRSKKHAMESWVGINLALLCPPLAFFHASCMFYFLEFCTISYHIISYMYIYIYTKLNLFCAISIFYI